MSCCVVPPVDTVVVEDTHEDQGLQMRGYSYLSVDGLTHLVFLAR